MWMTSMCVILSPTSSVVKEKEVDIEPGKGFNSSLHVQYVCAHSCHGDFGKQTNTQDGLCMFLTEWHLLWSEQLTFEKPWTHKQTPRGMWACLRGCQRLWTQTCGSGVQGDFHIGIQRMRPNSASAWGRRDKQWLLSLFICLFVLFCLEEEGDEIWLGLTSLPVVCCDRPCLSPLCLALFCLFLWQYQNGIALSLHLVKPTLLVYKDAASSGPKAYLVLFSLYTIV